MQTIIFQLFSFKQKINNLEQILFENKPIFCRNLLTVVWNCSSTPLRVSIMLNFPWAGDWQCLNCVPPVRLISQFFSDCLREEGHRHLWVSFHKQYISYCRCCIVLWYQLFKIPCPEQSHKVISFSDHVVFLHMFFFWS